MAPLTQSFLQGEIVEQKYTLIRHLGGSDHSAVFQTQYGGVHPKDAAIKLLPAPPGNAEARLSGWRLAANISHPRLMRIIDMGRCEVANSPMLFVVTELANENLSEILPQRPLTPAEVQDMLASLLDALIFLHNRGFVHGRVRPSNIMAVGEELKLSADTICRLGESLENGGVATAYDPPEGQRGGASHKTDIWSLGVTLVEALTQKPPDWNASSRRDPALPETVPTGFAEIARHCLRRDPDKRWPAAKIQLQLPRLLATPVSSRAIMGVRQAAPQVRQAVARTAQVIPRMSQAIAPFVRKIPDVRRVVGRTMAPKVREISRAIARGAGAIVRTARGTYLPKIRMPQARRYATGAAVLCVALVAIAAGVRFAAHNSSAGTRSARAPSAGTPSHDASAAGRVLRRVLPDVPRAASNTIWGTVRVGVRVHVDASGNVTLAELQSAGPSRYFARLSLGAARKWRFAAPAQNGRPVASVWLLNFDYKHDGRGVEPSQVQP
jgi:TonB family protein